MALDLLTALRDGDAFLSIDCAVERSHCNQSHIRCRQSNSRMRSFATTCCSDADCKSTTPALDDDIRGL
jgi:hypothetical protein